jgi:hypothetical protein
MVRAHSSNDDVLTHAATTTVLKPSTLVFGAIDRVLHAVRARATSEKLIEIDFRDGKPVKAGHR